MSSRDTYLLNKIKETKFLNEKTKELYIKKIKLSQHEIWNVDTSSSKPVSVSTILKKPELFRKKLDMYCQHKKGRQSDSCGDHYKDGIFSALMALFLYNQKLKEAENTLFELWRKQQKLIRDPIDKKYKSNVPTDRQRSAYMSYEDIVDIRESLPVGSQERLLLAMYTMIPPARSDYHNTRIFTKTPNNTTKGNYIVLNMKNPHMVLQEFKTKSTYENITIHIPNNLFQEIIQSLAINPRKHLFVSPRNNEPYKIPSSFNTWANRTLKTLTKKNNFSLTMLRHIYITRRDLKLEEKSGLEQEQIAKQMGHSINTQRRYMWHTFENSQNT